MKKSKLLLITAAALLGLGSATAIVDSHASNEMISPKKAEAAERNGVLTFGNLDWNLGYVRSGEKIDRTATQSVVFQFQLLDSPSAPQMLCMQYTVGRQWAGNMMMMNLPGNQLVEANGVQPFDTSGTQTQWLNLNYYYNASPKGYYRFAWNADGSVKFYGSYDNATYDLIGYFAAGTFDVPTSGYIGFMGSQFTDTITIDNAKIGIAENANLDGLKWVVEDDFETANSGKFILDKSAAYDPAIVFEQEGGYQEEPLAPGENKVTYDFTKSIQSEHFTENDSSDAIEYIQTAGTLDFGNFDYNVGWLRSNEKFNRGTKSVVVQFNQINTHSGYLCPSFSENYAWVNMMLMANFPNAVVLPNAAEGNPTYPETAPQGTIQWFAGKMNPNHRIRIVFNNDGSSSIWLSQDSGANFIEAVSWPAGTYTLPTSGYIGFYGNGLTGHVKIDSFKFGMADDANLTNLSWLIEDEFEEASNNLIMDPTYHTGSSTMTQNLPKTHTIFGESASGDGLVSKQSYTFVNSQQKMLTASLKFDIKISDGMAFGFGFGIANETDAVDSKYFVGIKADNGDDYKLIFKINGEIIHTETVTDLADTLDIEITKQSADLCVSATFGNVKLYDFLLDEAEGHIAIGMSGEGSAVALLYSLEVHTFDELRYVLFDTSKVSGADYYFVWAWADGKDGAWYDLMDVQVDGVYVVSQALPTSITNFKVFRGSKAEGHGHSENASEYGTPTYWNASNDLKITDVDNQNTFVFSGYDNGTLVGDWFYYNPVTQGTTFYVDVRANGSYWANDGAKTYLYAFNKGSYSQAIEMTRVGTSYLYKATISDNRLISGFVVVRAGEFDGKDWSNVYNQSADIVYYSGNVTANAIVLGTGDGNLPCTGFQASDDMYFANSYGYWFLQQPICLDQGGLTEDAVTLWAEAKTNYELFADLLNEAGFIQEIANSGDEYINAAMRRYDAAVAKNPGVLENFIARSALTSPRGSTPVAKINEGSTAVIIIVVLGASLLMCAALLIIKKRKYSK